MKIEAVIQQNFILYFFSFDNSDYQRNGDYLPTRLNAQKDGINLVCLTKLRSNPENNVGLLTLAK
jgi:26S proteasome regulatory subunit N10